VTTAAHAVVSFAVWCFEILAAPMACRYGLKHLAVEALRDLLASACHHAHSCQPALWFARFCGLAAAIKHPKGSNVAQVHRSSSSSSSQGSKAAHAEDAAAGAAAELEATSTSQELEGGTAGVAPAAAGEAAGPASIDVELLLSSPAALDFYLFCCCQLAYPNSVVALFPEGEDAQPLVRSSLVMESLKAVFR
jgi:hypothetical protein